MDANASAAQSFNEGSSSSWDCSSDDSSKASSSSSSPIAASSCWESESDPSAALAVASSLSSSAASTFAARLMRLFFGHALLLCPFCLQRKHSICLDVLPDDLLSLAPVCGVLDVLGLEPVLDFFMACLELVFMELLSCGFSLRL